MANIKSLPNEKKQRIMISISEDQLVILKTVDESVSRAIHKLVELIKQGKIKL